MRAVFKTWRKDEAKREEMVGCDGPRCIWELVVRSVWLHHPGCAKRLRRKRRLGSDIGLAGIILYSQTIFVL